MLISCVLIFMSGTFSKSDERASNGFETVSLRLLRLSLLSNPLLTHSFAEADGVAVCHFTSL